MNTAYYVNQLKCLYLQKIYLIHIKTILIIRTYCSLINLIFWVDSASYALSFLS